LEIREIRLEMGTIRSCQSVVLILSNKLLEGINLTCFSLLGQALDVGRKQVRSKEGNTENDQKLQVAEQKMGELLSAMAVLGKEAAAAMTGVEAQQQRHTLQRLISMVGS